MRITLLVTVDVDERSATYGELGLDEQAADVDLKGAVAEEIQSNLESIGAGARIDNLHIEQLQRDVREMLAAGQTQGRVVSKTATELVAWTKEDA
jgi:hypothetical protein